MTTTTGEEAIRKAVHVLVSLAAAAVVWRLPPLTAATVLAGATFVALVVETARRSSLRFRAVFRRSVGPLLRDREDRRLTGATTLAVAFTATAVLFPGLAALLAILVAGIADAVAAVVGKGLGRVRYPGGKSLEGSLAFLVIVFFLLLPMPGGAAPAALTALILTIVEAPDLPIDDNLYLPLATAAVVRLVYGLPGMAFFS